MPPGMSPSMPKGMPPPPKNIFSSSQASSSPSSNDAPAPAWRDAFASCRVDGVAVDVSLSRSALGVRRFVRLSFEIWGCYRVVRVYTQALRHFGGPAQLARRWTAAVATNPISPEGPRWAHRAA